MTLGDRWVPVAQRHVLATTTLAPLAMGEMRSGEDGRQW